MIESNPTLPVRFSWMEERAVIKSLTQCRLGADVNPAELIYSCDGVPENMSVLRLDKTKQRHGIGVLPLPDDISPDVRKKEKVQVRGAWFVVLENNKETEEIVLGLQEHVLVD